ncbi:UDP-N-acetylmuramate dehydrogenase [Arthrobacter psychrochitiniphilus]|uniref:UDP-N-acetylenolpyruvoylglucosamine reductase n=1 Tax=Arthrobacter psychrochitiniphilus TaxID=291045 RepID=A0A2V3DTQ5_9MICC|nr:UDP-N-acetylmuramate dehydrogenase [Arthrobacter psychrochitiniphilus]NYG18762.1 UDP-N-acetylmuramate dehydrogenase [Arthrobacter psychrochitiniphilus]PXA66314.1 UDP-N-acetylenolpyruvoylglucosamine reductase [Arthrobacter psychrochitiniphilus]
MVNAQKTLSSLTTLDVGGPARTFVVATTEAQIIDAVQAADHAGEPLLIIGGGSNLVVADEGFEGTVVKIASEGYVADSEDSCGGASVVVQAGHNWDDFVHQTVLHAWSGLEALSGIPGSTGATPVQNVGAYGCEVAQTIAAVRTWDRENNAVRTFTNHELNFSYRNSLLKSATLNGSPRFVVLTVEFQLLLGRMSAPIKYAELAKRLEVEPGKRANSLEVRRTVLTLRASKGMVLDAADRDTYSTGSFFTNPQVAPELAATLPADAPRWPAGELVKLSAAWLIEQAGFSKGYGLAGELNLADGRYDAGTPPRASLSSKHTLAITNRGGARAEDILMIARTVRDGVVRKFGITLVPEPVLVGCSL